MPSLSNTHNSHLHGHSGPKAFQLDRSSASLFHGPACHHQNKAQKGTPQECSHPTASFASVNWHFEVLLTSSKSQGWYGGKTLLHLMNPLKLQCRLFRWVGTDSEPTSPHWSCCLSNTSRVGNTGNTVHNDSLRFTSSWHTRQLQSNSVSASSVGASVHYGPLWVSWWCKPQLQPAEKAVADWLWVCCSSTPVSLPI